MYINSVLNRLKDFVLKMKSKEIYTLLSKYRLQLFAIACIWILFRHTFFYNQYSYGYFDCLTTIGDCGVDIFLFLSGFGLYYSFCNTPNIRDYYYKRFKRILPTVIFLLSTFAILDIIGGEKITKLISPTYWFFSIYSKYWYIGAILLFYIISPLIINAVKINSFTIVISSYLFSIISILIIKISQIDILYQLVVYFARIPIFIIGILFAHEQKWLEKRWLFLITFILSIPLLFLLPKDFQRVFYSLFVLTIVLYLPIVIDKLPNYINRILYCLGLCSLEFYLIHIYLFSNNALEKINQYIDSQFLTSIASLLLCFFLSFYVNKLIIRFK